MRIYFYCDLVEVVVFCCGEVSHHSSCLVCEDERHFELEFLWVTSSNYRLGTCRDGQCVVILNVQILSFGVSIRHSVVFVGVQFVCSRRREITIRSLFRLFAQYWFGGVGQTWSVKRSLFCAFGLTVRGADGHQQQQSQTEERVGLDSHLVVCGLIEVI